MADDIRPGDVVVCVGPCLPEHGVPHPLKVGALYKVRAILPQDITGDIGIDIGIAARPFKRQGFKARHFRKLPPATEEFTEQMRACKPAKQEQPA